MDLLAREAGDRFIGRFIGLHFLGGPARAGLYSGSDEGTSPSQNNEYI
jgi:hypothetical protein